MTKAFLFDMDGVLANTEVMWDQLGYDDLVVNFFGKDLASKVKVTSGMSFKSVFDEFTKNGWVGRYSDFHQVNMDMAAKIYSTVELTPGLDQLISYLYEKGFKIGIVSSSPDQLINDLSSRITVIDKINLKLSVNNHPTLKSKPAPDPYLYAMDQLGVKPQETIILEDSVTGVESGKASGATVICFTKYYDPRNAWQSISDKADHYAKSMKEVQDIVAKIGSR